MRINLLSIKLLKLIMAIITLLAIIPNMTRSQGLYWDPVDSLNFNNTLQEIHCIDSQTCIIRKNDTYNNGAVLELTTNGGSTWKVVFADTTIIEKEPFKVVYIPNSYYQFDFTPPSNIVLFRDSSLVWKSYDMGKNWVYETYNDSLIITYNMNNHHQGLKFINLKNSMYKEIYVTYNSGNDWKKLELPNKIKWDLFFVSGITKEGNIYFYTLNEDEGYHLNWVLDSGKTWKHINYGKSQKFEDVAFVNNETGYSVRHDKNESNITKQVVLKTVNSGETWFKVLDWDKMHGGLNKISYFDKNHILVTGNTTSWILRTNDAGANWVEDKVTGIDDKTKSLFIRNIVLCSTESGYIATNNKLLKLSNKLVSSVSENNNNSSIINSIHQSYIFDRNEEIRIPLSMNFSSEIDIKVFDYLGNQIFENLSKDKCFDGRYLILNDNGLFNGNYFVIISDGLSMHYIRIIIR